MLPPMNRSSQEISRSGRPSKKKREVQSGINRSAATDPRIAKPEELKGESMSADKHGIEQLTIVKHIDGRTKPNQRNRVK